MAQRSRGSLPELDPRLTEFIGDGDWTTKGWPTIAEKLSGGADDLDRVRDELAFAFPPDVCVSLARRREPMVMAPLFVAGIVAQTESLIALGLDLTLCAGWREKTNLLGALRSPYEFDSGRFEVAAWAALARAGLSVAYERPPATPDGKVADFSFMDANMAVALEAKRLPPSRADSNRAAIREILQVVAMEAGAYGTGLTFTVHQALVDACVSEETHIVETRLDDLARGATAWARAHERRLPLGRHNVPGLGIVDVCRDEDSNGTTWTTTNIEEDSREVSVKRSLRLVLQGSDQVHAQRDADIRAVAVQASPWRVPVGEAARYVQAMLNDTSDPDRHERDMARYRRLDAVVLVNAQAWRLSDVLVLTFPWSRPGVEKMRWVSALATLRVA